MRLPRRLAVLALGSAAALVTGVAAAPAATAATAGPSHNTPRGTTSLAAVLTADRTGFDHDGHDYDVVTAAVLAVLKARPGSAVSALTDGRTALTAFVPDDNAFRILVKDLTGTSPRSEKDVFAAVAALGIPTVEKVLLYHVVPGATITAAAALRSDGAALRTAEGGKVTVDVRKHRVVRLVDADRSDRDPRVVAFDLNKGNRQIAHGIDRVLRPVDLP